MRAYKQYVCKSISEIKKATSNLDIAQLIPLQMNRGDVVQDVKNWRGVYNVNRNEVAAVVVPNYNVITHKQYFDEAANVINRIGIKFSMTVKEGYHKAIADIDFENKNLKFTKLNEEFTTGIRLVNSYNKSTGLVIAPKYTRLACTNGMVLSRAANVISVKHHSKLAQELDSFIGKRINSIIASHSDLQVVVSESMKDSIEWKLCGRIFEKLFQWKKHRNEILKLLNIDTIEVTDKKSKKKTVTYVWNDDKKKKTNITRWEMYNAVTRYITHGDQITPVMENAFQKYAEKLLITPLIKMPMTKSNI